MDRLEFFQDGFCDEIDVLCKKCSFLQSQCQCKRTTNAKQKKLWIKNQKQNGRDLTLCGEFVGSKGQLQTMLQAIKKEMACGGSVKLGKEGYVLELQGKHKEAIQAWLMQRNFAFRNEDALK